MKTILGGSPLDYKEGGDFFGDMLTSSANCWSESAMMWPAMVVDSIPNIHMVAASVIVLPYAVSTLGLVPSIVVLILSWIITLWLMSWNHEHFGRQRNKILLLLLQIFWQLIASVIVPMLEFYDWSKRSMRRNVAYIVAMKMLMQKRALVRHLSACETMGSTSCICTDKTGTLTTNHMVVEKVWASGAAQTVSTAKGFDELRSSVSENFMRVLLEGVFHCSGSEVVTSKDGRTSVMGTPTETAILEFGLEVEKYTKVEHAGAKKLKVEPFNSVKKTMAVVIASPNAAGHPRAFLKGASEIVLSRCSSVIDGTGSVEKLTDAKAKRVASTIDAFACEALRTLCLAYQDVGGASDVPGDGYTLIAVFGIKDPLRPGVREAVKTCHDAGINVRMVTGDNINTAKAIARECGILTDDSIAIEGPEFRAKSPNEMRELIPKIQVMARSLPLDKHTLVMNLRGMFNEVVAVTGDGTNDAPALHEADIGLAMGIAGTEVAKENADVIIMDDNFSTIINVAKWGRSVYINIQKFVQFQLTVNVVALMVNFVSASVTGSAPLTIVQLLWVNLIMDTLGALALATEPPNDTMMQRPPVGRGDNFITKPSFYFYGTNNVVGGRPWHRVALKSNMGAAAATLTNKGVQILAAAIDSSMTGGVATSAIHSLRLLLDSGATRHVVGDKSILQGYRELANPETGILPDGSTVSMIGTGSIQTENFTITDVRFVEDLSVNLISVSQLYRQYGMGVWFIRGRCGIMLDDGTTAGGGVIENDRLYVLTNLHVPAGPVQE